MFRLVCKNKKGVSLVELLVCLVILGLLLPLAGQILYSLTNVFNQTVDRWDVQTAIRLASRQFETNKDGLVNSYETDILYDPVVDGGVLISQDYSSIKWIEGIHKPNSDVSSTYVMDPEGINHTGPYTYIFSAPAWFDNNGEKGAYLGELLFIRDYGSKYSRLILNDFGLGNIPVSIEFSVGTTENFKEITKAYTDNTVKIYFSSGNNSISNYTLNGTFALKNNTRGINYESSDAMVFEKEWLSGGVAMAYPAGWSEADLKGNTSLGYPKSVEVDNANIFVAKYEETENNFIEVQLPAEETVSKIGNVLRYQSPAAQKTQGEVKDNKYAGNLATCLSAGVMSGSDSDLSDTVLGNLRSFRDNVLAGTEFGDWFIHEYYYTWSPFLLEKTEFLKPVYKAILIPLSYVCGWLSEL